MENKTHNKQNPNKTKKCQNVTQTSPEELQSLFRVGLDRGLPRHVLDISSDSPLQKIIFPFAKRNQLKLSSCIGVGLPLIARTSF